MPFDTALFIAELSQHKTAIINESKRVIKKQVPKSLIVRNEVRDNLVRLYNEFTSSLADAWTKLGDGQKHQCKQVFLQVRDRVIRSFQTLGVTYKVPTSAIEKIDVNEVDIDNESSEEETMALTVSEFFNLASKLVPVQFDGSHANLQSFLDSLALLQANSEGHDERALAFVKTRLTGKARDLVTSEMSLDDISVVLKNNIKGESSRIVSAKLATFKQNFKDSNKYATEIESLANALKRAYISEGVPNAVAQSYATDATVKALTKNAASERTRLVMEAGTFTTVQEAITKLVSIESEAGNSANVLYTRQAGNKHYHNRNSRNNVSRQNWSDQRRRQFQNTRRGHNFNNFRSNYNYNSARNHQERHVRVCTQEENSQTQGNESFPQQMRLGETQAYTR